MIEFVAEHIIEFLLGVALTALVTRVRRQKKENDSLKEGMLSLLRAELIRSGEKYIEKKWVPIYAKDAYDKAYCAYHGLGGNGTMTQLHEQVMELPTSPHEHKEE